MLRSFISKRSIQVLTITLILSLLLVTTMTVLAAIGQAPIKADKGGTIEIDDDTKLIVPAGALSKNTRIFVRMVQNDNKVTFDFEPEGIVFNKPVYLQKSLSSMWNAEWGFALYYAPDENNLDVYTEVIEPEVDNENVIWALNHFSLYYYRRR